jgi:PKD repeat protein
VTLTVKDNSGGSATITQSVTVTAAPPANAAPKAAFSFSTNALQALLNGSASSDDGTITNFSWDFGDGKTDINNTATVNHTYLASGTYKVTLTVTDNGGLTNALTQDVTVSTPTPTPLISDLFGRTIANSWGPADVGGAWAVAGGAANFSVNGGTGKIKMATAGSGPSVTSGALGTADTNATVDISLDKPMTGGGVYVSLASRKIGNSEYRTTAKFLVGGSVQLQVVKIASGVSTTLRTVTVPGLTYNAGDVVTLRFQVSGTSSVALNAKVWKTGTTEPTAFQSTATDSSAPLTTAGSIALYPYLSGSSTNSPVVATFDNMTVVAVAP